MFIDCTLRDGGYYNSWDFSQDLIQDYLDAMSVIGVDLVEIGLRSLEKEGFKGACAYTNDDFIESLNISDTLSVGVMINASELVNTNSSKSVLEQLFPRSASNSRVDLVRVACHIHEFEKALNSVKWLKERGYLVGFNLMQIADRSEEEVKMLGLLASQFSLDVLYFADSMGSMNPSQTKVIIKWLRSEWCGALGIHTHDNQGQALSNTLSALDEGVTWVDSTVTGMGRGPGNARTEELAIEIAERRKCKVNFIPLLTLIRKYFKPMKDLHGWGCNPYYFLSGKYGIHPSYVQEMISDSRFNEEDIIAVIEHLRSEGGKKFSLNTLDAARHFYRGDERGSWAPKGLIAHREVLLLGAGRNVSRHSEAIERYIRNKSPLVIALNTQNDINNTLVDLRVACHPVRLLADCASHCSLPQPLITPYASLPIDIQESLKSKETFDFGIKIVSNIFEFNTTCCTLPGSLVAGYALAIATSGQASKILLAGFDGYSADDPRYREMQNLFDIYQSSNLSLPLLSITDTKFRLRVQSIYSF